MDGLLAGLLWFCGMSIVLLLMNGFLAVAVNLVLSYPFLLLIPIFYYYKNLLK